MNLPPLSIPEFALPFAVPSMMHPAIVHFAAALPVVIILLELINLAVRRKVLGSVSFVLMILMAVVYLGAYLTGTVDAQAAKGLTAETKALLDTHTNGGVWLVYGTLLVLVVKLISVAVKKIVARVVFLVVLGLFFWGATGVVQQGCALTYKHGVNVHKDPVMPSVVPEASSPTEASAAPAVPTPVSSATQDAAKPASESTAVPSPKPQENKPQETKPQADQPAASEPSKPQTDQSTPSHAADATPQTDQPAAPKASDATPKPAQSATPAKTPEATASTPKPQTEAAPAQPAQPAAPVETPPAAE